MNTIIFENEAFLIADKASGVLTVPSRFEKDDSRPCLGRLLEASQKIRLWPVHRLDFEVSGLVLFAKNATAHRVANHAFENRLVKKTYAATTEIAAGSTAPKPQSRFEWRSKLLRGKRRSYEHVAGKEAITHAICLGPKVGTPENLEWRLEPVTGRPHQLRVHLTQAGFPIVGDLLYGAQKPATTADTIELKAITLDFTNAPELVSLGLPAQITAP